MRSRAWALQMIEYFGGWKEIWWDTIKIYFISWAKRFCDRIRTNSWVSGAWVWSER